MEDGDLSIGCRPHGLQLINWVGDDTETIASATGPGGLRSTDFIGAFATGI